MLIANHYVSVNGTMYLKGEEIPKEELDGERLMRLLDLGAVTETASTLYPEAETIVEELDDEDDGETFDDVEAPDIDVADGIVTEEKPKRGRKK